MPTTFFTRVKKAVKENTPRFAAPAGFPALLAWSGGCGTRATRSNSPRRHPLTSLRYSAAHRGIREAGIVCDVRTVLVYAASVACATLAGDRYRNAQSILSRLAYCSYGILLVVCFPMDL